MRSWKKVIVFSLVLLGAGLVAEAGVLWVSPGQFQPGSPSTRAMTYYQWTYFMWGTFTYDPGYFYSLISLPNGVSIKKVTVYVQRHSASISDYVSLNLNRVDLAAGTNSVMAYISTYSLPVASPTQSVTTNQISYKTTNTKNFMYCLELTFATECTSGCVFYGAKIEW